MGIERPRDPRTADDARGERLQDVFERGCAAAHVHRERAPGIGYGNSSGYGVTLHFFDGHADPIFRLHW